VKLLIPWLFVLASVLGRPSPAQAVPESLATYTPHPVLLFPALQTHMPTKHGDVPHLQPEEQMSAPPQIKLDPVQLQREARELLELSQSLQLDIESVNRGLLPKDTSEKLKRIQKLAKHLRGEIAP
jgi:hypothetical protein